MNLWDRFWCWRKGLCTIHLERKLSWLRLKHPSHYPYYSGRRCQKCLDAGISGWSTKDVEYFERLKKKLGIIW